MEEKNGLISTYFQLGFTYRETYFCFAQRDGIVINEHHLKRVLRGLVLFRRKFKSDLLDVALFVVEELTRLSSSMWANIPWTPSHQLHELVCCSCSLTSVGA
jgi:hypothetical protein